MDHVKSNLSIGRSGGATRFFREPLHEPGSQARALALQLGPAARFTFLFLGPLAKKEKRGPGKSARQVSSWPVGWFWPIFQGGQRDEGGLARPRGLDASRSDRRPPTLCRCPGHALHRTLPGPSCSPRREGGSMVSVLVSCLRDRGTDRTLSLSLARRPGEELASQPASQPQGRHATIASLPTDPATARLARQGKMARPS